MQTITIDKKGKPKKRIIHREFSDEEFEACLDRLIEEDKDVLIELGRK